MEVICLETEAFYNLVEEVVMRMKSELKDHKKDKWISAKEAMEMLRITSKSTLGILRSEGRIRYSQPKKKLILYDRDSILEYLETNAKDPF